MATGDRKTNIYLNKLMSKTALKEQFLDYLSDKLDDTIAAFFQGSSGILDEDDIGLEADGNDQFKLNLTDANRVGTGTGQFVTIPDEANVSNMVPFENESGVTYYVGVKFASVEYNEVELNARYGNPEYPSLEDSFGELGVPDSVVDTAGVSITLQIDSITEAGVDHSGRNVKVWLAVPVSGVQSIAFYEGVSYYSGGNNYLDIAYSGANGPLGQDTSADPPSTTVGDYKIFIEGVTWKRNTDLRLDSDYAFIGTVQGVGAGSPPTVFSTLDQDTLLLTSLERAYNSTGAGLGRKVDVTSGAVELRTRAGDTGDAGRAQLRLDRLGDNSRGQFMLQMITGGTGPVPLAILEPVWLPELGPQEDVDQTGTNTISFTRVGVDISDADIRINNDFHVVLLEDSLEDDLYIISGTSSTSIDVLDMDTGLAPAVWTTGTARKATVLAPRVVFSSPEFITGSRLAHWRGFLFNAWSNLTPLASPLIIAPENTLGDVFKILDSSSDPNAVIKVTTVADGDTGTNRPTLQIGESVSGDPVGPGVRVEAHPGEDADVWATNFHALPARSAQSESHYNRAFGWHNSNDQEVMRMTHYGRFVKTNEFFEDFNNIGDDVTALEPVKDWRQTTILSGGGTASCVANSPSVEDAGGIIRFTATGGGVLDPATITLDTQQRLPLYMWHNDDNTLFRKIYFAGKFRALPPTDGFLLASVHLLFGAGSAGVRLNNGGSYTAEEYEVFAFNGTASTNTANLGVPGPYAAGAEKGWLEFEMMLDIENNLISCSYANENEANSNGIQTITFPDNTVHATWRSRPSMVLTLISTQANTRNMEVDFVHVWDGVIKSGGKDRTGN